MTANELLSFITQLFLILLGVVTTADYLRHRDATRRDVALVFGSLSVPVLIPIIAGISGATTPRWLSVISSAALIAQPYLLLRLVQYFRAKSTKLMRAALISMVISWVAVVIFAPPQPPIMSLLIIAYFVGINGYTMIAFVRGALRTTSIIRQRLRFAAAGSGLLALALLIAGVTIVVPAMTELAGLVVQVTAIACAVAFYVGFAPPRWLRHMWQLTELSGYLTQIGRKSIGERVDVAEIMAELVDVANRAVGGMAAAIVQKDEIGQQLALRFKVGELAQISFEGAGPIEDVWHQSEPAFLRASANLSDSDRRLLEIVGADTLLVVPIVTQGHTWGLLLVFLQYDSLFIEDDLSFITLLVNQSTLFLENSTLVEQLQRYSEGLEQEVQIRIEALRESEDRYQNILDNMLEGCQIIGFDWRYLYLNDSAARYGRTVKDELLGYTILEKYPTIEDTEMFAVMQRCMQERMTQHKDFEFTYPDGSQAWFEFSIQPVPEGIFILSLDITERKQAVEMLQNMNEELEQRVAERTRQLQATYKELEAFSYSVSHDLRAPLRAMDGFSRVLEEDYAERLDDEGKNHLARIRANSNRMGQLIDDLLELSRLTRSEMRHEQIDLSAVVRRIAAELREQYPDHSVELKIEDGIAVTGDARLLWAALSNLLGNAWKYTGKQPKPQIEFGTTEHEGQCIYFVRDNGVGFDMAYVGKLFGTFQRLHGANEFPGNGVGLATVQRIIARHGGRIWAEAAVGQGATFYFSL
jgi:PAS domain S-box-containing protein